MNMMMRTLSGHWSKTNYRRYRSITYGGVSGSIDWNNKCFISGKHHSHSWFEYMPYSFHKGAGLTTHLAIISSILDRKLSKTIMEE